MNVLLCAATEMEIAPTLQQLGSYKNRPDVLITGVGLMAATYSLTKAVAMRRPDVLLQAGIAGTFDETQNLASVVAVKSETLGDAGVEERGRFRSLFDLSLADENMRPWVKGKLVNGNDLLSTCGLGFADGVTVNEISTNKKRIRHYRKEYNAGVESLEGAALHYVGLLENLPFLQMRSLSNFIGERDKTKWMIRAAITNLNRELQRLLKSLTA